MSSAQRTPTMTDLRDGAELAALIAGAVESGLIEGLAESPARPRDLAVRLGKDLRAVDAVLAALAEAGVLELDSAGGVYRVPPATRAALVDRDSPDYAAAGLGLWLRNLRAWTYLAEVLERGGPAPDSRGEAVSDEAEIARYMAGMAAAPAERIARVVRSCLSGRADARSVLDLGGGPGHFARAFAAAGLEATLYDTPETISYVRRAYRLDEVPRLATVAGDFTEDPLGGPFDVALLSNVTHLYSPSTNRRLLGKVHDALSPGGLVAIADFVRGRSPRAPRFAVTMVLRTAEGGTYPESDYREWLDAAGFVGPTVEDVDAERQLITALRR